jgi:hypothetical protein
MTKSIELLDDIRDLYNGLLDGLDPCLTSDEEEVLRKIDTKFNELEIRMRRTKIDLTDEKIVGWSSGSKDKTKYFSLTTDKRELLLKLSLKQFLLTFGTFMTELQNEAPDGMTRTIDNLREFLGEMEAIQ